MSKKTGMKRDWHEPLVFIKLSEKRRLCKKINREIFRTLSCTAKVDVLMQLITNLEQLDLNGFYSYADYLRWQFSERVELIKGRIFRMSPAPNRKHQAISIKLSVYFFQALQQQTDKLCKVYTAPFDVRLVKNSQGMSDKEVYTVVQPDLYVICDRSKLDERAASARLT